MSNKSENIKQFFKYLSKPLPMETTDAAYFNNSVVFERSELYADFTLTLNEYIVSTYLGDDFTNDDEKINHYNWCWDRTCEFLDQPKIRFTDNDRVYKYFMNFYFDTFYLIPNKEEEKEGINYLCKVWEHIFNYRITKTRSELDSFIELYVIFEKSYKI